MMKLIECVPNFSEGIDLQKIKAITTAIKSVEGISVLDVDPGPDTNRTVITFVGDIKIIGEAAYQAIKTASEIIDMSKHKGAHARMGATDVCPFIPISNVSIDECIELSRQVGKRIGKELNIPVYLYGYSALSPERKNLSSIRKGEYEGFSEKIKDPRWLPDFGPDKFNKISGAIAVGARDFLIAYNINLNTKDHRLATDIAFELRESGRSKRIPNPNSPNLLDGEIVRNTDGSPVKVSGIYTDVKAVGWYIDKYKRAQISINFDNYKISTIHDVFDSACKLAVERGIRVTGSELVGLVPMAALIDCGKFYLKKQNRSIGVPETDIIECAIQSLGLNDLTAFKTEDKIIEFAIDRIDFPLNSLPVSHFLDELSRNTPAPGGGSVAALAGSLGAGLTAMVSNLAHEKKDSIDHRSAIQNIAIRSQKLKSKLSQLIDEDTRAFNNMIRANKLPDSNKKESDVKLKTLKECMFAIINIPFEVAKLCIEVLDLAEKLVDIGFQSSISDVGVASEISLAGVRGACLNVLINLNDFDDKVLSEKYKNEVNIMIDKAAKKQSEIFNKTLRVINKSNVK